MSTSRIPPLPPGNAGDDPRWGYITSEAAGDGIEAIIADAFPLIRAALAEADDDAAADRIVMVCVYDRTPEDEARGLEFYPQYHREGFCPAHAVAMSAVEFALHFKVGPDGEPLTGIPQGSAPGMLTVFISRDSVKGIAFAVLNDAILDWPRSS